MTPIHLSAAVTLAPEGRKILAASALVAGGLTAAGAATGGAAGKGLALLGAGALGFTLWFFRDPQRTPPPAAAHLLLAPADGKVVEVVDEDEPLYLGGPARRVSIFLSPLNVHVNRVPCDGVIEFDRYVAGDYLVAWHPKASEKNERSQLGLRHPTGHKVLFKQIAGAVARRIEYHIGVGDAVRAGQRFGIVKFGSRMDVIVPPGVEISARVGDVVTGGETVIGHIPAAMGEARLDGAGAGTTASTSDVAGASTPGTAGY